MIAAALAPLAFAALAQAQNSIPTTYATTRPAETTIAPSASAISSEGAAAPTGVWTSNVEGVAFNRFYQIWLENIDFDIAYGDPNMQKLMKEGILLTNYFSTTHPSEPNYAAVVGGDHFGIDNDDFDTIPANVSTVVDLLDTKGISWAEYQEHIPYPGFQGFNYSNQQTYANDYVRKHNPLILYDNVVNNATRLSLIKGFDAFYDDLNNKTLPQWAFITPNMTNDGHDTDITVAGQWSWDFLSPLLNNSYFMNDTLIILTFDEVETYTIPNKPVAILLGGAIPDSLKGTNDTTFYNHYSTIATVSQNWGLPSLGRWDCGANVFQLVSNKTGYANVNVNTNGLYFNESYPGPLSDELYTAGFWPTPAGNAKCHGNGVLSSIVSTWGNTAGSYNYTNVYPYVQIDNPHAVAAPAPSSGSTTPTSSTASSSSGTASPSASTKPNSASTEKASLAVVLGLAGLVAALM